MSRGLIYDDVTDPSGNAIVGAEVGVFISDGLYTTYADLWDAPTGGNPVANPLTTIARGIYTAYAEAAEYDIRVTTNAGTFDRPKLPVFDADDLASIDASVIAAAASESASAVSASNAATSESNAAATLAGALQTVATLGELQSIVPVANQLYTVKDYYSDGSLKSGRTFRYNATGLKSTHNGGTIISPTVPWNGASGTAHTDFLNKVGETDGAGVGIYILEAAEVYPDDFGAYGNTVWSRGVAGPTSGADDSKAIIAYLNYLQPVAAGNVVGTNSGAGGVFTLKPKKSYRVTEKLNIYADYLTFKSDGAYLVIDHSLPIAIQIGEVGVNLPTKLSWDNFYILSYQSGGTVVDVSDTISWEDRRFTIECTAPSNECTPVTIHTAQFFESKYNKWTGGRHALKFDFNTSRVSGHFFFNQCAMSGYLRGAGADEKGIILSETYVSLGNAAYNIHYSKCHIAAQTQDATFCGFMQRHYDAPGGGRVISTANNFSPFIFTYDGNSWTENVGCIIDAGYGRGTYNVAEIFHEPNLSGGTWFKGSSGNAKWNFGPITSRGGTATYAFDVQGVPYFYGECNFIAEPTNLFGATFPFSSAEFTNGLISNTRYVHGAWTNTVAIAATSTVITHKLVTTPSEVMVLPNWNTTVYYQTISSTTLDIRFGTAPSGADGTVKVWAKVGRNKTPV